MIFAQSCLTLCDPMDYSLPRSSVHGTLQVRILEWVAIPFSRGFPQPRTQTWVSCIAGRFFTNWGTREAHAWTWVGAVVVWRGQDAVTQVMGFGSRHICLVSTFLLAQGHTICVTLTCSRSHNLCFPLILCFLARKCPDLTRTRWGTCVVTDINLASN